MMISTQLLKLQSGLISPYEFKLNESTSRSHNLFLSDWCDVENIHKSGINTLDLDNIDKRFLISGCADGICYIHDMWNFTKKKKYLCRSIHQVSEKLEGQMYSVECVQWYPFDNGLFTTSGMDKALRIWDTTSLRSIEVVLFDGKIFQHDMSPVVSSKSLTAVAAEMNFVSLVDLNSGQHVQQLQGHSQSVMSVKWSPRDEYLLASGGCDGNVFLWDIRSTKSAIICLDKYNGLKESTNRIKKCSSHVGNINGLCFTEDGLLLLSYGSDNALRLWSTNDGKNQMVDYGDIPNNVNKYIQLDVSSHTKLSYAYVPTERFVNVYEILSGKKIDVLRGHYHSVFSCCYNSFTKELYTAGFDINLFVWTRNYFLEDPEIDEGVDESIPNHDMTNGYSDDEDSWSLDEAILYDNMVNYYNAAEDS